MWTVHFMSLLEVAVCNNYRMCMLGMDRVEINQVAANISCII